MIFAGQGWSCGSRRNYMLWEEDCTYRIQPSRKEGLFSWRDFESLWRMGVGRIGCITLSSWWSDEKRSRLDNLVIANHFFGVLMMKIGFVNKIQLGFNNWRHKRRFHPFILTCDECAHSNPTCINIQCYGTLRYIVLIAQAPLFDSY